METVSSTARFAVHSTGAAIATPAKCHREHAVPRALTISRSPAARSINCCASGAAWPRKIHTSSGPVQASISSTRSKWKGMNRNVRPPCAGFTDRPLPANPNSSPLYGPTVTSPSRTSAVCSLSGSVKSILLADERCPKNLGRARQSLRASVCNALPLLYASYRFHTGFIPILHRWRLRWFEPITCHQPFVRENAADAFNQPVGYRKTACCNRRRSTVVSGPYCLSVASRTCSVFRSRRSERPARPQVEICAAPASPDATRVSAD